MLSRRGSAMACWVEGGDIFGEGVNVAARLEGLAAAPPSRGCAEIQLKFALRRPTQLAHFTERLFEHRARNLVHLVMLHVNAPSRSVRRLATDHDVAHCAYFSAFRGASRNLLRKEPKPRLLPRDRSAIGRGFGARPQRARFAADSFGEEDGFETSVPRCARIAETAPALGRPARFSVS